MTLHLDSSRVPPMYTITAHIEDGKWWATCSQIAGFSAASDSWDGLVALIRGFMDERFGPDGFRWLMVKPLVVR